MPLVCLEMDEWYPVWIYTPSGGHIHKIVTLSQEEWDEYQSVQKAFDYWQHKLASAVDIR